MNVTYTYFTDLTKEVEIPDDGILSRTIYNDEMVKVVLFGFDSGQELSEHTASVSAILHIIQGEAHLTLGADSIEGQAESWVHMPPNLPHSIYAKTPVVMLLILQKAFDARK